MVNFLIKPSVSRDIIGKPKGAQIKVRVTEKPRRSRATRHMIRFLAGGLGVASSSIDVAFGRLNVHKQRQIKAPTHLPSVFQVQTTLID
ncbi:DUF167 family protein [Acidithiobacillus ferriphilus]|uniref:DUF167 domain-containing protein n=1 Tax=Acidithiobacillus ferriphilus TaxID=1689834 RepID=UPI00390C8DAF